MIGVVISRNKVRVEESVLGFFSQFKNIYECVVLKAVFVLSRRSKAKKNNNKKNEVWFYNIVEEC